MYHVRGFIFMFILKAGILFEQNGMNHNRDSAMRFTYFTNILFDLAGYYNLRERFWEFYTGIIGNKNVFLMLCFSDKGLKTKTKAK